MKSFDFKRRDSWPVKVGNTTIGGDAPVRVQSMANTSTMDTEASVSQTLDIVRAGGELVRFTAQGVREATNLKEIRSRLRDADIDVPLVADIHFNPKAAFEAARNVDKIRINPGNFVDPGRVFKIIDYTDESYAAERAKIADTFVPLLELCREKGTALRIGVNHGSLSDRIMSRYGDTPEGIVESAMEFLRVALEHDFKDIVISIKASNPVVMVHSMRLLVHKMEQENMFFPLHLGVTEAGDGDDGRIKSAVGIGALLAHGLGDTIRVSLSEPPAAEIPVAMKLRDYIAARQAAGEHLEGEYPAGYDPITPTRRTSRAIDGIGGNNPIASINADVVNPSNKTLDINATRLPDNIPPDCILKISTDHPNKTGAIEAAIHTLTSRGIDNPVVVSLRYDDVTVDDLKLYAAADMGTLILDGMVDGIEIVSPGIDNQTLARLSLDILQAARARFFKTEYISCPSCGRTLFDLETTLHTVREATSHLKGLKIGVMGCVVNGPGEMADADYGYVGAARGKISLYRGKKCIEMNIPSEKAVERLIEILKADGVWQERKQ